MTGQDVLQYSHSALVFKFSWEILNDVFEDQGQNKQNEMCTRENLCMASCMLI